MLESAHDIQCCNKSGENIIVGGDFNCYESINDKTSLQNNVDVTP